jgi:hypothetical protein
LWCRLYLDGADHSAFWPLKSRPSLAASGGERGMR